jgi:hypothetical protein
MIDARLRKADLSREASGVGNLSRFREAIERSLLCRFVARGMAGGDEWGSINESTNGHELAAMAKSSAGRPRASEPDPADIVARFGAGLKAARLKAGLTQFSLLQQYVSVVESGKGNVTECHPRYGEGIGAGR